MHKRFCNIREAKDETELENLAVEDATYYDGVASKVYLIRDKKEDFDTSLRNIEAKAKAKQEALNVLPNYEVALKIAKAEYEGCKKVVSSFQQRAIRKIFRVNMGRLKKQLGS